MKKRRIRLIVLRTLKRLGLLCKPEPKDPYIKVSSVMYPDGTRTVLSGKVRRDEIVIEMAVQTTSGGEGAFASIDWEEVSR